jgi:hypothetical protein
VDVVGGLLEVERIQKCADLKVRGVKGGGCRNKKYLNNYFIISKRTSEREDYSFK